MDQNNEYLFSSLVKYIQIFKIFKYLIRKSMQLSKRSTRQAYIVCGKVTAM